MLQDYLNRSKRASHIKLCIRISKGEKIYLKNAAVKKKNLRYNQVINKLKKNKITLNRKIISEIILKDKDSFNKLINHIS